MDFGDAEIENLRPEPEGSDPWKYEEILSFLDRQVTVECLAARTTLAGRQIGDDLLNERRRLRSVVTHRRAKPGLSFDHGKHAQVDTQPAGIAVQDERIRLLNQFDLS